MGASIRPLDYCPGFQPGQPLLTGSASKCADIALKVERIYWRPQFTCIHRLHLHSLNRHVQARLLAEGLPKKFFGLD